jgi:hypothetical protein
MCAGLNCFFDGDPCLAASRAIRSARTKSTMRREINGLAHYQVGGSMTSKACLIGLLLGGDLNVLAEKYLLEHYTGETISPRTAQDEERLVKKARRVFESDFAKSCHHGSADFTEYFLQAINAHATVISSGDDEPHAHPRADTLGTVGKHSRGRRSSIFSTELARSAPEQIEDADAF